MNFKSTFWGVLLIIFGGMLLLDELLPQFRFEKYFFPIMLMIGGIMLIFKDKIKANNNNGF